VRWRARKEWDNLGLFQRIGVDVLVEAMAELDTATAVKLALERRQADAEFDAQSDRRTRRGAR
jgi:hypothetical protein